MTYIVWIDSNQAKLFKLSTGKMEEKTVTRPEVSHAGHHDPKHLKNEDKYFHEVAKALTGAKELLLVGPGLAKTHFANHLKEHHHAELAGRVVGVETVDHPTENQVLALARKFFKAHDMFA